MPINDSSDADALRTDGDRDDESKVNLNAVLNIPVDVQVVLGTTNMPVAALMKLQRNAIITLDQRVGEPVTVVVNGRVIARGEMIVVDEASSKFGVSLTEIVNGYGT